MYHSRGCVNKRPIMDYGNVIDIDSFVDDEEEETRVFQSVSQRGRQRRVRTFD